MKSPSLMLAWLMTYRSVRPRKDDAVKRTKRWGIRAGMTAAGVLTMFAAALTPAAASTSSPDTHILTATPEIHLGQVCKDGRSTVHNRSARICIMVNSSDVTLFSNQQALVNFTANSGTLRLVRVNHLDLITFLTAKNLRTRNFASKKASGRTAFMTTGWRYNVYGDNVNARVYNACMFWTDGGKMCFHQWIYGFGT
jgi:hypothetical protein